MLVRILYLTCERTKRGLLIETGVRNFGACVEERLLNVVEDAADHEMIQLPELSVKKLHD